jgi:mRNA-degrading endonuclease YafQ of YafQ-DinJ toxin-antitoxin module
MINISYSRRFFRKYDKLVGRNSQLEKEYAKCLTHLVQDPFYPGLKTHRVNITNLGLVYSSRVTGDIRILWKFLGRDTILILTTGGHEGKTSVYK